MRVDPEQTLTRPPRPGPEGRPQSLGVGEDGDMQTDEQ